MPLHGMEALSRFYENCYNPIVDEHLRDHDLEGKFMIIRGNTLSLVEIPIGLHINEHYFLLGGRLLDHKAFFLAYDLKHGQPRLVENMDNDGRLKIMIGNIYPFTPPTQVLIRDYMLSLITKEKLTNYDYPFFGVIRIPKSRLPFVNFRYHPRMPELAARRANETNTAVLRELYATAYSEYGNMSPIILRIFQALLTFDDQSGDNFQTKELEMVITALGNDKNDLVEARTIDIIVTVYAALKGHAP